MNLYQKRFEIRFTKNKDELIDVVIEKSCSERKS